MAQTATKNAFNSKRRSELTFVTLCLIYPMVIFAIFYLYVNFNSILLAFKVYENGKFVFADDLFVNFRTMLVGFVSDYQLTTGIKNSLIIYVVGLAINMPLQIIFSYFIWKKIPLSGFFKVVIFIPSIVSSMVYVTVGGYIFKFIIPEVLGNKELFLLEGSKQFPTVFIYGLLIGVGGNIVYYLGAMSSTDQSVVEYGKLDGLNSPREFWHIILPHIWPTMISFMVVATSQFFTEKGMFYAFFAGGAEPSAMTLGYYFFKLVFGGNTLNTPYFPQGAAGGFIFTMLAVPLTFGMKYLLERFGPSED